mgnify:CR=1 FL=1
MNKQVISILSIVIFALVSNGVNILADSYNSNPAVSRPYMAERDLIEVMFEKDSQIRLRAGQLTDMSAGRSLDGLEDVLSGLAFAEWKRICDLSEEKIDQLEEIGESRSGRDLYNLNNTYRLRISSDADVWEISSRLEQLPEVILARPVPRPVQLPSPGYYIDSQFYLDPATATPTGMDAEYAWGHNGGKGQGVTVCDLEYGWTLYHSDISKGPGSQINPNPIALPPGETDDHGTAVIGMLVADVNSWGTTGICNQATLKTCGTYYGSPPEWNVPGALLYAIDALSPGDVILLEQQWDYSDPNTSHPDLIPIEWWLNYHPNSQSYNAVYAAIETAIAKGISVVEVGGNGGAPTTLTGIDTDNLTWYGNSGAVIVGAGGAFPGGSLPAGPEGDLERLNYSSYGSRFDLQGQGENVYTTGYGDLFNSDGLYYYFTRGFAGTSSAAPCVAGAIACCVGYWKANVSTSVPTPEYLRDLLIATGTPQVSPSSNHIGPRPDLRKAFDSIYLAYTWVDITTSPLNSSGYGTAWGDYDKDGDHDLYISSYNYGSRLYRNDGGGSFTTISGSPPGDLRDGLGVAWGDYDGDGDLDLYLGKGDGMANKLFRNDGNDTFVDVTSGPLGHTGDTFGVTWADYDKDGDLDIYMANFGSANKLLRNDGGGTFTDVTPTVLADPGNSTGVSWGDYDNDGDADIYLANNGSANKLFRNDGGGSFTDVTSGPLGDAGNTMGVTWGDTDNDLDLDLFLVTYNGNNKLLRNDGGGLFNDISSSPLSDFGYGYGCAMGDYDNDGDLDIYLAMGSSSGQSRLLRNEGGNSFVDAASNILKNYAPGTTTALADCDSDGDLDIFITNNNPYQNKLFENKIGTANHWIHVDVVGTESNTSGIGAKVKVVACGSTQIREIRAGSGLCSQNSLTAEFGLGMCRMVDSIIVTFPSDSVKIITNTPADQDVTIPETVTYICGDANSDQSVDVSDAVFIINYAFAGGTAPDPLESGDVNCDDSVDVSDAVYIINYAFAGGNTPCDTDGDGNPDC